MLCKEDLDELQEDLENLIAKNIQELFSEDQLMVLMQENKFQEHADILALDEKGDLYIFELKRWAVVNKFNFFKLAIFALLLILYQNVLSLEIRMNDLALTE